MTAEPITRTMPTRIRVSPLPSYVPDFDEPVQSEVAAGLDSGELEAYAVRVQRKTPGGVWKSIPGAAVTTTDTAGHSGYYDNPDTLPTAGLRENARNALADVDPAILEVRAVAVRLDLPASLVIEVDPEAWALEYGTATEAAVVGADVRDFYGTIAELLKGTAPFSSGIAWMPPAE